MKVSFSFEISRQKDPAKLLKELAHAIEDAEERVEERALKAKFFAEAGADWPNDEEMPFMTDFGPDEAQAVSDKRRQAGLKAAETRRKNKAAAEAKEAAETRRAKREAAKLAKNAPSTSENSVE